MKDIRVRLQITSSLVSDQVLYREINISLYKKLNNTLWQPVSKNIYIDLFLPINERLKG